MAWQKSDALPNFPQQNTFPSPAYFPSGSFPGDFPAMGCQKVFAIPASEHVESNNHGANSYLNSHLAFSDKTIRNGFIRKVYSILMCQLAVSAAFIAVFVFNENLKGYAQRNPQLLWIAFIIAIVCLFAMSCFETARRQAPTNYIFLLIFTVAQSFFLGVASSVYRSNEVLLAVGICTVICFGLTVFSFQTKIDFTRLGGILFIALFILLLFSLLLFFWSGDTARLVFACVGAFIFSVYLIYDTQLMIGGEHHKYAISPEDYVFAALNLYIDIIQLFLMILSIIGSGSRD